MLHKKQIRKASSYFYEAGNLSPGTSPPQISNFKVRKCVNRTLIPLWGHNDPYCTRLLLLYLVGANQHWRVLRRSLGGYGLFQKALGWDELQKKIQILLHPKQLNNKQLIYNNFVSTYCPNSSPPVSVFIRVLFELNSVNVCTRLAASTIRHTLPWFDLGCWWF